MTISRDDAQEFTEALAQTVGGSWRQILLAQKLGVPKALGLKTDEWVNGKLGGYVRYNVEDRRAAVQELKAEGLSNRQAAAVLGVDEGTIRSDSAAGNSARETCASQADADGAAENSAPVATVAAVASGARVKADAKKQAKRKAKEEKREERREANRELVEQTPDVDASGAKFATIVMDPPWDWGDEGDADQFGRARPTYATMTFEQLLALPVNRLADVDCHLYLWITNRSLPKGFALLERWGFRYVTTLVWCKPSIGMGNYFRGSTELLLFGVKGQQGLKRADVGTWFSAPRGGQHSEKPAEFFALAESCSPGPYLEMFARSERPGWSSWGAEANVAAA